MYVFLKIYNHKFNFFMRVLFLICCETIRIADHLVPPYDFIEFIKYKCTESKSH